MKNKYLESIFNNAPENLKPRLISYLNTLTNAQEAKVIFMPIENVVGWKKGDIIKAENKEIYKIAITDETTNSQYNTTWYPVHLDIILENVYDILGYDMLYNNKHVKIVASTDRELNVLSIG